MFTLNEVTHRVSGKCYQNEYRDFISSLSSGYPQGDIIINIYDRLSKLIAQTLIKDMQKQYLKF